ncbi:MAG: hypothetical protein JSU82_05735 [Rhodospirillales bacterium]|nr:MAG: hypothetical protein JSU82_05735 [Rhodospirillales bacterium]
MASEGKYRRLRGATGRFLALVVMPFAVAALYLLLVASDRYVSETRFTLRDSGMPNEPVALDLGMLIGGVGGLARQDAYVVRDYILSYDLLARLDAALDVRKAWSDPSIDPVWRLAADASEEDFLEYYRDMVDVSFDSESAIITVTLEGFEPAFAQTMLDMILAESEQLVNKISNQLAAEQLGFINGEIEATAARLKQTKSILVDFQNEHQVLDPKEQAGLVTNVIAQMEVSLAEDRAELTVLRSYLDGRAPEVVTLRNRIAAKTKQIEEEKTRLTGGSERLNTIAARFEELRFDVEFAHERYRLALMALEKAQIDASRKVKSLVVVARPNRPDEALYPDRPYFLATLGAFLLMGFGVFSVIFAAIREHME